MMLPTIFLQVHCHKLSAARSVTSGLINGRAFYAVNGLRPNSKLRRDSDLLKPYFHMGSRFSSSPQLSIPDLSTVGPAISMIDETISTIKKGKELYSLANIKLVAAKPSHVYLPRNDEIKELWGKYKALRNANPPNTVVALYIKGTPACGKTQLAREFAESFFDAYKGSVTPSKHVVVATLDLKSESRFWRSYHRLAVNINCPTQGLASANKLRDMLSVTANEVQRQLRGYTNWLLVVEGLTSHMDPLLPSYWPPPGAVDWGNGCMLITTNDDQVVHSYSSYADSIELGSLSEAQAITLLNEESGCSGEGAQQIISSDFIRRVPLDIISAGIYIKEKRLQHPSFSYIDYLDVLKESAPGVCDTDLGYAISKTAQQLAESNPILRKIFFAMALCRHEPLPMNVIARYLGVRGEKDPLELKVIRDCHLLGQTLHPADAPNSSDIFERIYVNQRTQKAFRELFIRKDYYDSDTRQQLLEKFVQSLLEQYEEASRSISTHSYWLKQTLFPHLEAFYEKRCELPLKQQIQLCLAVSNLFMDLNRNGKKAMKILKAFKFELSENSIDLEIYESVAPRDKARIDFCFGKAYSLHDDYANSRKYLTRALQHKRHLSPIEVADILKIFGTTVASAGEYMESRKHLEEALQMYEEKLGLKHPAVVDARSTLAYLCFKLGDWDRCKEYVEGTEDGLKASRESSDTVDLHTLRARENLAVVYNKLGDHNKSISLLERVIEEKEALYGSQHPSLAIPMVRLTSAYYYNGDMKKVEQNRERFIALNLPPPLIPLKALQIIINTIHEFGDVKRAEILLERLRGLNSADDTRLQQGKVNRLAGQLKKSQTLLEGYVKTAEKKLGKEHIRGLYFG